MKNLKRHKHKISICFVFLLILSGFPAISQVTMCPLDELIDKSDPGWPLIQKWIKEAANKVEVFPCDSLRAKDELYKTQVSTHSIMGAVIYHTGGVIIDNGWIRILASGSDKINRSIMDWNKGKTFKEIGDTASYLLIADDAAGGFYAINAGGLGKDLGKVYYLSPDELKWNPLDISYTDFILFCFNGDLNKFYSGIRWKNWLADIIKLDGNSVYNFYPYLWTKEGHDVNRVNKKSIPIEEAYQLKMEIINN